MNAATLGAWLLYSRAKPSRYWLGIRVGKRRDYIRHLLSQLLDFPSTAPNVQKRAARWICAKWDRSTFCWSKSYEDCRRELKWQTLQQRRHMLSCCQVYKITKQLDCLDFDTYFKYRISVTRSHDGTLVIPSSRINAFRYSFFVNVPFLWNSLPAKVINCPSYSSFKFNCTSLVSAE